MTSSLVEEIAGLGETETPPDYLQIPVSSCHLRIMLGCCQNGEVISTLIAIGISLKDLLLLIPHHQHIEIIV
jgi:hypothetical protein